MTFVNEFVVVLYSARFNSATVDACDHRSRILMTAFYFLP